MVKARTTITISKDLLKQAKEREINISAFVDIELRRYIALIENKKINNTPITNSKNSNDNKINEIPKNSKSNNTFSIYDTALGARGVAWHPSTLGWE